MQRDEIIEMAEQAGSVHYWHLSKLEAFAKLVADKEREAIIDLVAMYGGPVDLEAAIRQIGEA